MPITWYIVPYKRNPNIPLVARYCAMDDYTIEIKASGGNWAETEISGNRAIVKVRASAAILTTLNGVFKRLPKDTLDDPLSSLSNAVKTALRNEIQDQGYTLQEIQARFGSDLGQYTLKDVLKFMASRRHKPRYEAETDTIVFDGPVQACRTIESVEAEVN